MKRDPQRMPAADGRDLQMNAFRRARGIFGRGRPPCRTMSVSSLGVVFDALGRMDESSWAQ
jgi:hypothetical protein